MGKTKTLSALDAYKYITTHTNHSLVEEGTSWNDVKSNGRPRYKYVGNNVLKEVSDGPNIWAVINTYNSLHLWMLENSDKKFKVVLV